MAFRRQFRRRFGSGTRSVRRRGALNWSRVQPPRKWQMGNFNLSHSFTLDEGSATSEFLATFVASPMNFMPQSSVSDFTLNEALRRIEVGGVVWNEGWSVPTVTATGGLAEPHLLRLQSLWTMNWLDEDQFAIGIGYDWSGNSQPVSNVGQADKENNDEPIRILDRWTHQILVGDRDVNATGTVGGYIQTSNPVRGRSLRLRAPIDDKRALLFTSFVDPGPSFAAGETVVVDHWCIGTIYYRYRF